ncbi:hypothetical protein pEaSNUABM34_00028 [Erwinia phage pEa_SNUABM_34]|nr:hypothetical protein pEaSNUABM34_00028 [Erwinia phage pEa_SNUABM_34]
MRPENISRTYRVGQSDLEKAHNVCGENNVTLSDVVRRYIERIVLTEGEFLMSERKHVPESQLNVRLPFYIAHSFASVCKSRDTLASKTILNFVRNIALSGTIPEELKYASDTELRAYITSERSRLDALEAKLK